MLPSALKPAEGMAHLLAMQPGLPPPIILIHKEVSAYAATKMDIG